MAFVRQVVVEELSRCKSGNVVSQDLSTFACVVQVDGMPPMIAPWYVSTKFAVAPGTQCVVQFDQRGQVRLVGVNDKQAALEPAVLGTTFTTFFNLHTHTSAASGSPTSPPVVPMTPAQLSVSQKVRP
jgi:hypothetical protein